MQNWLPQACGVPSAALNEAAGKPNTGSLMAQGQILPMIYYVYLEFYAPKYVSLSQATAF